MNRVETLTQELLNEILSNEIYQEYLRQRDKVSADPELFERVEKCRLMNYQMQMDQGLDHFTLEDKVNQEMSEMRNNPEVNSYLHAELALCRELQQIMRTLIDGIDFTAPDF